MSDKPLIGPARYSSVTRNNATVFLVGSARSNVLKGHNPTVGESNYLARIRNTWRETRITRRIVQRGSEIRVPRAAIGVRVSSVVSIKPGFYRTAAHVAHDLLIGGTPRQPNRGS